ncbi:MAG: hypothetical protein ACLP1D_10360 [Xanthobacteraceae bacterium]
MPRGVKSVQAESKLDGFRRRSKAEEERRKEITDSEYWVAFCFESRAQKEEFLGKLGLLDGGDKYVDGLAAAKAMGVAIESPRIPFPSGTR